MEWAEDNGEVMLQGWLEGWYSKIYWQFDHIFFIFLLFLSFHSSPPLPMDYASWMLFECILKVTTPCFKCIQDPLWDHLRNYVNQSIEKASRSFVVIMQHYNGRFFIVKAVIVVETGSSRYNMAFVRTPWQDADTSHTPLGKLGMTAKASHSHTLAHTYTHTHTQTDTQNTSKSSEVKKYNIDSSFQSSLSSKFTTQSPTVIHIRKSFGETKVYACREVQKHKSVSTYLHTRLIEKIRFGLFIQNREDKPTQNEWAPV